ncbi:MAG: zinc transporter permease [Rhodospirillales bacterium]|nr:zinc transporter permease [Rhodospirillales bacterium]
MNVDDLWAPFVEFGFMRRGLVAALALSLAAGPLGTLLQLRRLSLVADVMSHAVLPGAAVAFLFAGFSLSWMGFGGLVAGLCIAVAAGFITRSTPIQEDASFAALYILAIASGVAILSTAGSNLDLVHVLFGSLLAIDDTALLLIAAVSSLTLLVLAACWRALVVSTVDPDFLRARGGATIAHTLFLVLLVLNLVAGFQALGTVLSVGLLILPPATARLWARSLSGTVALATGLALLSSYAGLIASYAFDLPSGPSIVLAAGALYVTSLGLRSNRRLFATR